MALRCSGAHSKALLIGIAVPIRDKAGRVVGAFAGVTDLSRPNFLQQAESKYGHSGGYLLVDRKNRLVITASDKSRVMSKVPDAGVNLQFDRFINGDEGSAVYTNQRGVEVGFANGLKGPNGSLRPRC